MMKRKAFLSFSLFLLVIFISQYVFAESTLQTIQVAINSIKIKVNGTMVQADNLNYDGTTYVPLRAISEILGKDVTWDGKTSTANIDDNQTSTIPISGSNPPPKEVNGYIEKTISAQINAFTPNIRGIRRRDFH